MKRILTAIILVLCMIGSSLAGAEGLLPSLTDTIGKPMPSLGEALGRYPDEEIPEEDGSNTELFRGVTETDFNTFSVYLSEQGAKLADYQAAGTSFSASIQVKGKTISFAYDTQTLEAAVTYPKGTYDEWLEYAKTQYESVIQLLNTGKTDEAMSVLFTIPNYDGYGPAAAFVEAHPELAAAVREAKLAPFRIVGGYVTFGSYEQDNNTGNGKEPIEWLVLDYDAANHRVLLLSRYGLEARAYEPGDRGTEYPTWEKSDIRWWLNGTFLNEAFTDAEQEGIVTTTVRTPSYNGNGGGADTQDEIWLLNREEVTRYLSSNASRKAVPTAYAVGRGVFQYSGNNSNYKLNGEGCCWWWLRSPGRYSDDASFVSRDGSLNYINVYYTYNAVRPAFWLNLDSGIF